MNEIMNKDQSTRELLTGGTNKQMGEITQG